MVFLVKKLHNSLGVHRTNVSPNSPPQTILMMINLIIMLNDFELNLHGNIEERTTRISAIDVDAQIDIFADLVENQVLDLPLTETVLGYLKHIVIFHLLQRRCTVSLPTSQLLCSRTSFHYNTIRLGVEISSDLVAFQQSNTKVGIFYQYRQCDTIPLVDAMR